MKKIASVIIFLAIQSSIAQIKVACIGNSITRGAGIENRAKYNYPTQLQNILGEAWEVKNYGVSGRTMLKKGDHPIWKEEKFKEALAYKPDVVIIKLGTNDSKHFNWKFKEDFQKDYQAMIDTFKQVSNPVFFICLPVPVYGYKWSIDSLTMVNEVMPMTLEVAGDNNLIVIDLFNPLLNKKDLFPDLIHPNAHGASVIAGVITKYLIAALPEIVEVKMQK